MVVCKGTRTRFAVFVFILVVVGLLLRIAVPPMAPIHPNTHGIEQLRVLLEPDTEPRQTTFISPIYTILMAPFTAIFGASEETVFRTNSVLGCLTILSLVILGGLLGFPPLATAVAAAAMALTPAQVWLSFSESPAALFEFLELTGLVFLLLAARRRGAHWLWLGVAVVTTAAVLRVLTVFVVPVAAILFVYELRKDQTPLLPAFKSHLWASSGVALFIVAVHIWGLGPLWASWSGHSTPGKLFSSVTVGNILFDPTLIPTVIPILAAMGLVGLWASKRDLALALGGTLLILLPLGLLVDSCREDAVRYQVPGFWGVYLFAGAGFSWLTMRFRGPRPTLWKGLVTVVTVLAMGNTVWALTLLARPRLQAQEHLFIRKTLDQFPPGTVITVPMVTEENRFVLTDFPDYGFPAARREISAPTDLKDGLVYLGIACYRTSELPSSAVSLGINRRCAEFCGGLTRKKVAAMKLVDSRPSIGYQNMFDEPSTRTPLMGFYRCLAPVDSSDDGTGNAPSL